jgi:integrase
MDARYEPCRLGLPGVDTGARLEGIVNLTVDDIDLDACLADIVLKGRREHEAPFGAKTAQALDRYLRARRRHPRAKELPHLWLGPQGRHTKSGVAQMLKRRCNRARPPTHTPPPVPPHRRPQLAPQRRQRRRPHAHHGLDLYGRSAADARASAAHQRRALGDRF